MRNILEILSLIREIEGIKKELELADILNVSPSNISSWKKRGTIPYEVLFRYCSRKGINFKWLLFDDSENQPDNSIREPDQPYIDSRDKIIQQLTEENIRLKKLLNEIQSLINKSHNKC